MAIDTTFVAGTTVTSVWLNHANDMTFGERRCPEDYGAVGDGVTDDKAALLAAFNSGYIIDGNNKTYAVNGTITPTAFAGLQNISLIQISDTTLNSANTLNIVGFSNFSIENVNINMGSIIGTLSTADDGNNGLFVAGTDYLTFASNIIIRNVKVTGNGSGTGIHVRHCTRFKVSDCSVYDRIGGGIVDPTNDCMNGYEFTNCKDFIVQDSNVYNQLTRLGGVNTLKWNRGFLFVECVDCVVDACVATLVDQGYDWSGSYNAGLSYFGNRRFVQSACVANECRTYSFKYANVAKDGLVTGCTANNAGFIAFVFSPNTTTLSGATEVYNTQNIDVVGCKVVNVLGTGWAGPNAEGFRVMGNAANPTYPRGIRFKDCHVADTQSTPTTQVAYKSDATIVTYNTTGYDTNIANTITNCTADNVTSSFASGVGLGPNICQLIGTTTQSLTDSTWSALNWDSEYIDPTGLHNPASQNPTMYIKSPGWYRIYAQIKFTANATGSRQIRLLLNGGVIAGSTSVLPGNASVDTMVTTSSLCLVPLSGQNIRMEAYQDSGGALNVKLDESLFYIERVGA